MDRIGRFFAPALLAVGLLAVVVGCTSESQSTGLRQQPSADDKGVVQAGHTTGAADRVEVRATTWDAFQDTLQHRLNGRVVLVDYWMNS
jgi:N-formylglutamate amidohydrolase